jgi:hypothetical protein
MSLRPSKMPVIITAKNKAKKPASKKPPPAPFAPLRPDVERLIVSRFSLDEQASFTLTGQEFTLDDKTLQQLVIAQANALRCSLSLLPSCRPPEWVSDSLHPLLDEVFRILGIDREFENPPTSGPAEPPTVKGHQR